jgi:hypothetical protein
MVLIQPVEPGALRAAADAPEPDAAPREGPAVRRDNKRARLIDLLHRPDGATMAESQQATGWQPHTIPAAVTRLKKKSFGVASALRDDRARACRPAVPWFLRVSAAAQADSRAVRQRSVSSAQRKGRPGSHPLDAKLRRLQERAHGRILAPERVAEGLTIDVNV